MKTHRWADRVGLRLRGLAAASLAMLVVGLACAQAAVTIAVTGDIYTPDARQVSDVILAQQPLDGVLLVGDTCNTSPTPLERYRKIYAGTYDRFLALIFPCPGNHDKLSKPAFSAYSEFWGRAAHAPDLYYSFDLGGWHAVSLDSVTFRDGGAAAEKQLAWLKADLAAHPRQPTMVYWHYPLFSHAKHCGDPKMKSLWAAIYAHGPALVFNGHNHVYERFPPLDPEGHAVEAARGVQEFVIGPGGAAPVKEESDDAKPPASAFFHGGAQHVGFFTLQPDGRFQYTVKAIDKKNGVTVVDHGAGVLPAK